ncbi:hypothetical protein JY494_16040 [Serratia marcescens]|nr:hypothetical protein [Serratia marcescens]
MGFLLRPTMPAPATHAAELIRFSTGHKPPGFAGGLLLPGVCVAQQYTMMLAQKISERQLSDRLFTCCSNACR